MRKIFHLSLLFLGLIAASCSKEEIAVNTTEKTPVWTDNEKSVDWSNDGSVVVVGADSGNEDGITDPNDDPDGKTKPKKP